MKLSRPSLRLSLLSKVAIWSSIPILVLSVVLGKWIEEGVRERNLASATHAAELVAGLGIQPLIDESDLSNGLSSEKLEEIDRKIRAGLLGKEVARIKIWNDKSQIIYSEDPDLIGQTFGTPEDLGVALEGEVESELSEPDAVHEAEEASERQLGRLLEVYVPITFSEDEEPAGAFEIYLPYEPIERATAGAVRQLQFALLAGLILLYVILFKVVAAASQKLRDQSRELKNKASENEFLAFHDALTGLPNRSLFHNRLKQAILKAQRHESLIAVMLMDLDRFKEINDTLGHHNGDLMLQQLSTRLRSSLREYDSIARLGGDEFAILVTGATDAQGVLEIARRMQGELKQPFEVGGFSLDVSGSIGISMYPDHGDDADDLIQRADVAMYAAKEAHAEFAIYDGVSDPYSPSRLMLMGELRRAIDSDQLTLHYQPKIDLQSGRVVGVEALARWIHPERGMIAPDDFISLAEHTGLIKPLSVRVLDLALAQHKAWREEGFQIGVAVNLSTRNLLDPSLPDAISKLLGKWDVPAASLTLEITESSIMADHLASAEILDRLSSMGVSLSVDDFGTGYSSLAYLKRLPVSEIKIDRSFVTDMDNKDNGDAIVRSTIGLARNLNMQVVAEGVETAAVCNVLADLDCDIAQGYFISRPMDAGAMTSWLGSRDQDWARHPVTS
jgi:diguanylate cyclase (GGDEF)-like protein